MENLERRKVLAKFAGWTDVAGDGIEPEWFYGREPIIALDGVEALSHYRHEGPMVPHFEEDPAAACSLLPKIARRERRLFEGGDENLAMDYGELIVALSNDDGEAVCRIIFEAVQKIIAATAEVPK